MTTLHTIDAASAFDTIVIGSGEVGGEPTSIEHRADGTWRAAYSIDGLAALQAVHQAASVPHLPADDAPGGLYEQICKLSIR